MCSKRSMGCVYCMWQLVFADIINNKTEFYIDIINWTWYIHVMIDAWLYSLPNIWSYNRLISLFFKLHIVYHCNTWDILIDVVSYNLLITILFMLFPYLIYLHDSIIICSHVICTCTFPLFYTHWEFWLPEFTHPGIWVFLLLSRHSKSTESLLLDRSNSLVQFLSSFLFCWLPLIPYYLNSILFYIIYS